MLWKAGLALLLIAAWGSAAGNHSFGQGAEDPNAQYLLLQSGELREPSHEVPLPVEVGVLRLHVHLSASPETQWTLITPAGKPLVLTEPNISVSEGAGRRTISIWDPRPGAWKIRLSGTGKYTLSAIAQGELYLCCMQFWARTGVYGLERYQPVRGVRVQAQVYVSGFNIDTLEFDLINDAGERIAPLQFRQGDFSNPYNFTLLFDPPAEPFRVHARGRDTSGKPFQRVFPWLLHPVPGPDPQTSPNESVPNVPQWVPPQEWNKTVTEGEFKIVRTQIVSWKDQLLLSEKGNPIGIRLTYTTRFPIDGSYLPLPQVYPERIGAGYTGALQMRVHKGMVEPIPEGLKDPNQLFLGTRATFRRDTTYTFTVDLVPNYAFFNEPLKNFCVQRKAFTQNGSSPERFEREIQSEQRFRYRLSFSGSDLDGRTPTLTENLYVPRVWSQGFQREGAGECP